MNEAETGAELNDCSDEIDKVDSADKAGSVDAAGMIAGSILRWMPAGGGAVNVVTEVGPVIII